MPHMIGFIFHTSLIRKEIDDNLNSADDPNKLNIWISMVNYDQGHRVLTFSMPVE